MNFDKSTTPYLVKPLPVLFLAGLIVVNTVAIFQFDPYYIGAFFAFIYIIIIPGFLLLPFLTAKKLAPMLGVVFSAALSILMLMLVGLGLNTLLPLMGMKQPLTMAPLLIAFDGLVYLLLVLNFLYKKNSPFEFHEFNFLNWVITGASLLLPVLACLGAIILNNGGSNFLTMVALALAAILIPVIIFTKDKISPSTPPITLYLMALSFLLMNSMRGWFITGHDILLEYHVFMLVNEAHRWSMALYQDPYMACLSLTVLPTYLVNLLHVDPAYIFKFFIQFIGALPVVATYYLAKEYGAANVAVLVVQLLLTSRFVGRFGVRAALTAPPACVAALTPLIDLPAPNKVTATERDAYRLFANSYQSNWSTYMDPACLRVTLDANAPAGKRALRADLRILPIIDASDYNKMQRSVGEARIDDPARASGAWVSLGS